MADEHLVVAEGEGTGDRHPLGDGLVIGRDPECTLTIDDARASRRHARIGPGAGGVVVEDLGSTNGTFVNDARIAGPTALRDGDRVKIGSTVLTLEAPPPAAAATVFGGGAPAAAPPPPAAPPAAPPAPPPLAAPDAPHGYPEPGRPGPAPEAVPAPALRAAPDWQDPRVQPAPAPRPVPGARPVDEGMRALRGDAHQRMRAYIATVAIIVLVALVVVLYLLTR